MRAWGMISIALVLAGCGDHGVTYVTCHIMDDPTEWRFTLNEPDKSFRGNSQGLAEISGPAEFGAEQVWLLNPQRTDGWFINRRDMTWGKLNAPPAGKCEKTKAPKREF